MKPTTLTAIGNESLRSSQTEPEKTINVPDAIANGAIRIVAKAKAADAMKQAEANIKYAEEKAKREETERIIAQLPGVFRATHPSAADETLDKMINDHSRKEAARKIADLERTANNLHSRLAWIEDMK